MLRTPAHRSPYRLFLLISLLVPLLAPQIAAAGGAGLLDTTFGANGVTITTVGAGINPSGGAAVLAQQSNGAIVLAAPIGAGSSNSIGLVRYTAAGVLDSGFGSSGSVISKPISPNSSPTAVAVQSDGAIVVAGVGNSGGYDDFLVARYTTAGVLDTSFNTGGYVTTDIATRADRITAMALDGNGKIVVVGWSTNLSGVSSFTIARYTTSGVLDASFGTGGVTVTAIGGLSDTPHALAIQPDGSILVVGTIYTGSAYDLELVRYTSAGVLDTTFNTTGKVRTTSATLGGSVNSTSLALRSNGTIVVAARIPGTTLLLRYTSVGALDSSFGTAGIADVSASFAIAPSALQIANDQMILGGTSSTQWFLARYNTDGTLDTTFGAGGTTTQPPIGSLDQLTALGLTSGGALLAAGANYNGSQYDFAIARYDLVGDTPISGLNASNNGPTTRGSQTQLSASITAGTNVTYSWDFGDGTTPASGAIVNHTYAAAGLYTATVIATNGAGSVPTTTQVTVNPRSYTLTVAQTGTGSGTLGGGGTFTENTSVTPTATPASGSILVGWTPSSCASAFALIANTTCTATINLDPATQVAISGLAAANSSPAEVNATVAVSATISAGTNVSYSWNYGDGSPLATGAHSSHSYTVVGSYTAIVTASNTLGSQSASTTVQITTAAVVRYVDTTGSNTGTCTILASPCLTIGYALTQADQNANDRIHVASGSYTETLTIAKHVWIQGAGAATTFVQTAAMPRKALGRPFTIASGITATITGLTIRNGAQLDGGGVQNNGILTMQRVTLVNNLSNTGGGIYNVGTLTLDTSTVISNTASVITSTQGLTQALLLPLTLPPSTRDPSDQGGWRSPLNGPSALPVAMLVLVGIGLFGLVASLGLRAQVQQFRSSAPTAAHYTRIAFLIGGMGLSGALLVGCQPVDPSHVGQGGGIYNAHGATLIVTGSTITRNRADKEGGGIYTVEQYIKTEKSFGMIGPAPSTIFPAGTTKIDRTLLTGNGDASCAGEPVVSGGYNMSAGSSCAFGAVGDHNAVKDVQLGAFSGEVVPLLADSPAINASNCVLVGGMVLPDQAGTIRPQGSECDIGATELVGTPQPYLAISARGDLDRPPPSGHTSFTVQIENQGAVSATGLALSYTPPTGLVSAGSATISGGSGGVIGAFPNVLSGATLAPGAKLIVTIPLNVTAAGDTALTNSFTASSNANSRTVQAQFVTIVGPAPSVNRFVAITGIDTGGCTDLTHPCQTIQYAHDQAQPNSNDLISVAAGIYTERIIQIAKVVTIKGSSMDTTIIQAAPSRDQATHGVMSVYGGTLILKDVTLRYGYGGDAGSGGIVNIDGTVTLNHVTISDSINLSIKNTNGHMTINNSTISRNSSGNQGGGIYNAGWMVINNSMISDNTLTEDPGYGGGIINYNTLTINNSTISGNSAPGFGGGIDNYNTLTINNSTISGNTAGKEGGGIYTMGVSTTILTINNSTISGNTAGKEGGGIFYNSYSNAKIVTLNNTIVSANVSQSSNSLSIAGFGPITANHNILQEALPTNSQTVSNNNQIITNASTLFLRPVGTNGQQDPGDLHAKPGSPAIGIGVTCPATDYDGRTRANPCTAGAYEYRTATLSANGGPTQNRASTAIVPLAGIPTNWNVTTTDGPVTLSAPTGAVTQTVALELSLAAPTGGAGRIHAVRLTARDGSGNLLDGFSFSRPLTITLAYSPTLVTNGQEDQLILEQFNPLTNAWQPDPSTPATVDKVAQTVTTRISSVGDYGLFVLPRAVLPIYQVYHSGGPLNLRAGDVVTYTLLLYNGSDANASNLSVSAPLPAGVTFRSWVQQATASQSAGTISWPVAYLARGGLQQISFSATIGSNSALQGTTLSSTATLIGANGGTDSAVVSVNGPPSAAPIHTATLTNTPVTILPLLSVGNADLSQLTLSRVGTPAHGTASISNGTITYTPAPGYFGTDSFSYTVQDGGFSTSNTVTIIVGYQTFLPLVVAP